MSLRGHGCFVQGRRSPEAPARVLLFRKGTLVNRATKAAMTAALPFMALPLTLAGPLPTSAAASANSTSSAGLVPPGPATVLHTSPTPWSVPNHLDGVFCADTRVCQEVYYQAIQSYGPIELGLAENVEALDFAINHASGDKVAYGFSGGARAVSAWLERQADSGEASPDDTDIVLIGNSGRKYGGINGFFWGNVFNILMTPTDTDFNVLDVAREFDPIADFPDNPFNLLALANAVAAFTNTHLTYSEAELDAPGNYVWKEGNTTYVYIPTAQLPILQGLRDLGLDALADQLEAPLRKMIEPAYTRDYLENATVIPAPEAEADPVLSASSASPAETGAASGTGAASATGSASETGGASEGVACSGYRTDGCDILAEQSYRSVTAPDLENPAWENVLPNLFNAVMGIPRAYLDGLNDLSHALEVTGSWWVYTPTNVLGYDPADPPKITAVTNLMIPFPALSNPLAEHVSWWAKANLPMDAGCTGTAPPTCTDANSILSKMFQAPLWDFISGYQFPELINPVSDAEGAVGEEIPGEEGAAVPWSGQAVQLNPMDPVYNVVNYLFAPPEQNAPEPISLGEVAQAITRLGAAVWDNFNPFVPGSFLWKGYPYTMVTPFLKPFVSILCPQCDPDNPEDPTPFEDDVVAPSSPSADSTVTALVASSTSADDQSSVQSGNAESATEESPVDVIVEETADTASTDEEQASAEIPAEEAPQAQAEETDAADDAVVEAAEAAEDATDTAEATATEDAEAAEAAEDAAALEAAEDAEALADAEAAEADKTTGADTEKGSDEDPFSSESIDQSGSSDKKSTLGGKDDDSESGSSSSQGKPGDSGSDGAKSSAGASSGSGGGDD